MHWSSKLNPINLVKSPSRINDSSVGGASNASVSGSMTRRMPADTNAKANVTAELGSSLSMLEDESARKRSNRNPFSDDNSDSPSIAHLSQSQHGNTGSFTTPTVFSTPMSRKDRKNSSVRSILRGPNTPGTGQSVRFFSRDAYRLISPNHSFQGGFDHHSLEFQEPNPNDSPSNGSAESIVHDSPVLEQAPSLDHVSRFGSILLPDSLPNGTNLFDMSLDMPVISGPPEGASNMLSDDAVEVPEFDHAKHDGPQGRASILDIAREYKQPSRHKLMQTSFSDPSVGPSLITAPTSPIDSAKATADSASEADTSSLFWTAKSLLTSRLFGRATPNNNAPTSFVDAQRELIQSLRDELDVQLKIASHYQTDLDSRDELVEILSARIEVAETELEAWRSEGDEQYTLVQVLKKQLLSLERAFHRLQVDGYGLNQDNSIAEHAGGEALKSLQARIKYLEQEKGELEDKVQQSADCLADAQEELDILRSHVAPGDQKDDSSVIRLIDERHELREKVLALEEADEAQRKEIMGLQEEVVRLKKINVDVSQTHRTAANEWQEERDDLMSKLADAELGDGNGQEKMLQEELEAQWERMERATEEINNLKKENQELKSNLRTLEENGTDERVDELADQLNEILANQQVLEEERDQLSDELRRSRQHVEDLMQSHSDLQRKLETIKEERSFASDNGHRLEHEMAARDLEIESYEEERRQQFTELESLRAKLSATEKEHGRQLADRTRRIEDLERQLQINAEHSTQILNETADRDVYLATLEEKANSRLQENDRLRQRVHELEQESAAKEVRLVECHRDKDRAKEDNINLNIALDSKQQELELIKRKLGVKGTAGATPASSRARNGPRESSIFGITPRPLTGLNDTFAKTPGTMLKAQPTGNILASKSMISNDSQSDAKVGPPTISRPRVSISSPTPLSRPLSTTTMVHATPRQTYYEKNPTTQLAKSMKRTESTLLRVSSNRDSLLDEKENQAPLRTNRRSNLMVPA